MNENEAITVTLTLENDEELECAVLSIFEAEEREYIALLPLDENGDNDFFIVSSTMAKTQSRIWKTSKTIRNLNVFQMHLMS